MHAKLPATSRYEFADRSIAPISEPAEPQQRASGSIENPSVSLDDADVWGGGFNSASGQSVSPQKAMRLAPFWQAANLISGDIAKLPLDVFVRDGKDRLSDPLHPAWNLVRWEPNADQTAFEFWQDFVGHLLIWRNAFAWIVRSPSGRPLRLVPLLPDRTAPEIINGRKWYVSEIGGKLQLFDPFEILHVRGLSFNGRAGLELCEYARDVIGRSLARQNFQSRFYHRGGRTGGILELPAAMPKQIKTKVEAGFRSSYESPDAAFQTVVLRDNAKFHAAQSSWKDAQLLEASAEDVREVARLFNCPPHKLGDNSKASFSSLEQENRSYYDNCLSPWLVAIKQGLHRKLLTADCRADGCHFFDYNVGAINWADVSTVSAVGNAGILAGWLLRNEVRRWFNLPGIEGGDVLLVPLNMGPANKQPDAADPVTDPAIADPPAGDDENDDGRSTKRITARDCSPFWFSETRDTVPKLLAPPTALINTESVRAAVDQMIADASSRFVNRLRTAAARRCKNAQGWESFIDDGLDAHLETGRAMFAPANQAREAIGLGKAGFALAIVDEFRQAAQQLPLPVTPDAVAEITI